MKKILLDVGGTFIKCSDGRSIPVDSNGSRDGIVAAFREACRTDAGSPSDVQLRAAVPGPFDYSGGQFLMRHKFAAVYGEYFADLVGIPRENCRFAHDVNCMLLGECGDGCTVNTALIALGTGLGFAMCVDGKILENELGSPLLSIYNRPFRDGVLEDYASKRGVTRLYLGQFPRQEAVSVQKPFMPREFPEAGAEITVKEIAERARAGEKEAAGAFCRMGEILGETLAPIVKEYRIERLLLGGQISRSADLFIPSLRNELPGLTILGVSDFDNATFNGLKRL